MKNSITTEEARKILSSYLKEDYLLKHSRETEVIMRALARRFGEDEDVWGIAGLLHDLDLSEVKEPFDAHGQRACEILEQEGFDIPEIFQAIRSHTENIGALGVKREARLDYCLAAAENITGLITAYVLMRPDKKIINVEPKSVNKRLKEKRFAAKVNREFINDIEKTGLPKMEFLQIAVNAMKDIADEIGM